jgi:hypothetical protein
MLVSSSAYSSTLKIEAACSSETSIDFQWTRQRYIPEDRILNNHRYDNFKSYRVVHAGWLAFAVFK